ncbi:insulinase family protein [Mariprofundus sp. EBB-1]|uniref:M16 family metallopeptidase n=1 Tax=Mariprofundus sp. EBB-1 TaxID=2650971 RepID=UPI000EF1973D|nr:pitrilysin family protein [Mariprofundus sp. EBB-1]RLL51524.1 insulinase family protein [Mariprofundus sp. EBB-1]
MNHSFYSETQIDNGPLVLSHAMPHSQSVALGIFINVGSRDEIERLSGITHALEHMLFKGTDQMDVHQLAEKLDDLGGNANAFTSRERTCFHLHVLHEHWLEALDILMQMVREPALPEAEWQREREVIYAEMAMVEDTPEEWVMDQHLESLFPDHSLGRPVLGTHASLSSFSTEDLSNYLQHWYNAPRLLIVAAGNIDHNALIDAVGDVSWGGKSEAEARIAAVPMASGVQALPRAGEQAQIIASFPGIVAASEQRPVAWLANQVLGGGMSSTLFREIREKRGLAYGVGSHLNALSDTGTWSITCGTEPKRAAECVDLLSGLLHGFASQISSDELERSKRQLQVQFRMGLDSVEGQMLYLGSRLDEQHLLSPRQWLERVQEVDVEAVRLWASEQLSTSALWSVAAPEQSLAQICDRIRL